MTIKTAYVLPFRVTYPTKPFFSSGGAVSLVVQLSKDSGTDHISEAIPSGPESHRRGHAAYGKDLSSRLGRGVRLPTLARALRG